MLVHSMGAAAAVLALRRRVLRPRSAAPPSLDPETYASKFTHYMKILPRVLNAMKSRLISS
ncbi:MAG: hypothetical protein ABI682_14320 [Acidobacteriota bacterium]